MVEIRNGELYGTPREVDAYRVLSNLVTVSGALEATCECPECRQDPDYVLEVIRISVNNLKCISGEIIRLHKIDPKVLLEYHLRQHEAEGRLSHEKVEAALAQIHKGEPMTPIYSGPPPKRVEGEKATTFEGAYHA
ncbi:MAG: hypothetical protein WC683_07325 [bacterium]|jgi:hypothetical protein